MDDLQALVDLVSKNKTKKIELIGEGNAKAKYQVLYEELSKGRFQSEEEAADFFYSGNKNKTFYFQRLKKQLKTKWKL